MPPPQPEKWQINDFRIEPQAMKKHGFDDWAMWTGAESSPDKEHASKSSRRYWDPYINTPDGSKAYPGEIWSGSVHRSPD
jgi:hypothetical protein